MRVHLTVTSPGIRKSLVFLLIVGLLCLGCLLLFYSSFRPASTKGVECTKYSKDTIITFFYKSDTTPAQQRGLIASTGGTVADHYISLQGYGIVLPTTKVQGALATLRSSPQVVSASASATEGCLDPD